MLDTRTNGKEIFFWLNGVAMAKVGSAMLAITISDVPNLRYLITSPYFWAVSAFARRLTVKAGRSFIPVVGTKLR